ncbi:SDR family oxidoreductase [Shewanella algae]|uniref:SDR family oxidoreductase n=1 Tax=Shewanella algae TaxID=38313 RepID=UPI001BF10DA8|nr:SDR family oxidoreductase [Shewanella algae]BCV60613.1 hypothetical protein TUM17386_02840 [Shewanella algae]
MRKINNGQQWALVTGALGGIGKALTNEFVDAGYSVIATDIKSSNIKETNIYYLQLDLENFVLDENYAAEFYQNVSSITNGNGISCLINNAATQILADTGKITRRQWNASLNVNLSAPFFFITAILEGLGTK